ncbi:MAG: sensor histidine kinase [Bacteroidia bacterium]
MKKFTLFVILLLLNVCLQAQDPFYRLIGKSDGLPSNSVYDIFQDSKGFIWCAHNEGLSRYDGFRFESYFSEKQSSKAGSYINEDIYGRIWYSNFDGYLYYVENDSLKELQMNSPFGYTRYGLTNKYLYVIVQNGIDIYDLRSLQIVKQTPHHLKRFASSLNFNNKFYLQEDSIYVFDGLSPELVIDYTQKPNYEYGMYMMHANKNEILFSLKENKGNAGWLMNKNNQFKSIPYSFKGYFQNYAITDDIVWACSQSGVFGFDKRKFKPYNNGNGLFTEFNISSVFKDNKGNFWFSTLSDGLLYVPNLNIKRLEIPNEKPFKLVKKDQGVVIGTRRGGIYYNDLKGNTKQIYAPVQHEIISLVYDEIDENLFFTEKGFNARDKEFKEFYTRTFSLKDICRVDKNYYAYASSGNIGFFNFKGKPTGSIWDSLHFSSLVEGNKFVSAVKPYVIRGKSVAFYPPLNYVYFATNIGLYVVGPNTNFELKNNGNQLFIKELQVGENRIFCLNGNGSLFEIYQGNQVKEIPAPPQIKDIKYSGQFLFLITEDHLYQLDIHDSNNQIKQLEYIAKGQEINDVVFLNNQLIIATNQGLVISKKDDYLKRNTKPPFYILSCFIGGKKVSLLNENDFVYSDNKVEINYAVLNYNKAEEKPVYYRINKGNWILCAANSRSLILPSLSPNQYDIEFKIGDFDTELTRISFEIAPPFYFQLWFILMIVFGTISILYYMYEVRLQRIKTNNQLQLEKIELQKSLGQSMLTAIKSQMNPHFFYNALNTIQSFIYSDDKKKASNYLAKFSKLTRLILEMSEKETVSLSDELISLKLYLELEEVRFEEAEFEYEIKVDSKLDAELVRIPSMMIQPYVENAIKHGLLHKRGLKKLEINIYQDIGILVVEVDDNGIGREQSSRINAGKLEKWTSFSTGANEKRLEILNRGRSRAIGVLILDKKDENNLATGTFIKISIPLNN